jgi:hypothetical protein
MMLAVAWPRSYISRFCWRASSGCRTTKASSPLTGQRAACHPLGCVALLTGLVLSLGTRWGLLKYYWVVIALVLTTLSLAVLLLDMPRVSALAGLTRTLSADSAVMSSIPRSVSLC